jgi:hypothetical protein
METYFDNKNVSIQYSVEMDSTFLHFKKFTPDKELREAFEKTLDLFKQRKCKNHITEATNMGAMKWETQEWLAKNYIAEMIKCSSNQLKLGFVVGDAVFSVASVKNVITKAANLEGKTMKAFNTMSDCEAWLRGTFSQVNNN